MFSFFNFYLIDTNELQRTPNERKQYDLHDKMLREIVHEIKHNNDDGLLAEQIKRECANRLHEPQTEDDIEQLFHLLGERSVFKIGDYNALKEIVKDRKLTQIIDRTSQMIETHERTEMYSHQSNAERTCKLLKCIVLKCLVWNVCHVIFFIRRHRLRSEVFKSKWSEGGPANSCPYFL